MFTERPILTLRLTSKQSLDVIVWCTRHGCSGTPSLGQEMFSDNPRNLGLLSKSLSKLKAAFTRYLNLYQPFFNCLWAHNELEINFVLIKIIPFSLRRFSVMFVYWVHCFGAGISAFANNNIVFFSISITIMTRINASRLLETIVTDSATFQWTPTSQKLLFLVLETVVEEPDVSTVVGNSRHGRMLIYQLVVNTLFLLFPLSFHRVLTNAQRHVVYIRI